MDDGVQAYTNSVDNDEAFVLYDIEASVAHATMLGRQNIISSDDASRIVRGLNEIADEYERGAFELQAELEDVHMNVERRLYAKIGPLAGRLHTARSRNDQVATDFRLYVRDAAEDIAALLLFLQTALVDLAEANIDVVFPGYTHLQRAQPVLFAHHLLAYVEMFHRDFVRYLNGVELADELPLGSGALAGVPYPVDREFVARELGFGRVSANSIDAVSDRDFVADFVYACSLTMVHVSRLAEEIILWSSAEFGFVQLPDAFATGSSIMPQKKNPDVAELARGRTGSVIGDVVSILTTLKGLPLAYNRDLQEDKAPVFHAESVVVPTLRVLARMLPHLSVDGERSGAAAVASFSLATDLADYLVRKGLAFREAHEAVGKLVRQAEDAGVELHALTLEDYRRCSPLFDEGALSIDVNSSLAARDIPGGTAPKRVAAALTAARKRLDGLMAGTADGAPVPADEKPAR